MNYDYLMNTATIMFFICYVPELYANYKNKNANIYNLPEKILLLSGTGFAFTYACCINDTVLISNYAPLLTLDLIALLMRAYYIYKNSLVVQEQPIIVLIEEPTNSELPTKSSFFADFQKSTTANQGKLSAAAVEIDTSPITQ
jgi:hypothetical protein